MGVSVLAGALAVAVAVAVACGGSGSEGGISAGDNGDDAGSGVEDATTPSGFGSGGGSSGWVHVDVRRRGRVDRRAPSRVRLVVRRGPAGTCAAGLCSITENPANASPAIQAQLKAGGKADVLLLAPIRTIAPCSPGAWCLRRCSSPGAPTRWPCTSRRPRSTIPVTSSWPRKRRSTSRSAASMAGGHDRRARHRHGQGGRDQDRGRQCWQARSPSRGPSRREACTAPCTTRHVQLAARGRRRHHAHRPGRDAADRPQDRLRERLPHGQRGRLDSRRRRHDLRRARATTLRNDAGVIHNQSDDLARSWRALSQRQPRHVVDGLPGRLQHDVASLRHQDRRDRRCRRGLGRSHHEGEPRRLLLRTASSSRSCTRTRTGHTLAKMDFDLRARKAFSNLVDVATDPSSSYVAWPSFTPDGKSHRVPRGF